MASQHTSSPKKSCYLFLSLFLGTFLFMPFSSNAIDLSGVQSDLQKKSGSLPGQGADAINKATQYSNPLDLLNKGSALDLVKYIDVDGLTGGLASKIVAYRDKINGFKKIGDLMSVEGVKKELLAKIQAKLLTSTFTAQ